MKAVPEDRREAHENNQRKDEIIEKLTDERGNIGLHTVRKLAVGVSAERSADREIQHIVDHGRGKKGDRASQQNEPRSAENAVKGAVIVRVRRDSACREKDQTGQQIDHHGKQ